MNAWPWHDDEAMPRAPCRRRAALARAVCYGTLLFHLKFVCKAVLT